MYCNGDALENSEICSTMGTKNFEIDEEMSEIIDAKVGNPQNSTSKK